MARNPVKEKYSIKYILERTTPENIFSYYWNIPIHEITQAITTGKAIFAPYRDDVSGGTPSLGFYENNGKLYARDFGGYFWGDCFDAAAFCTHSNTSGKAFGVLLERIINDMGLDQTHSKKRVMFSINNINRFEKSKLTIDVNVRDWNVNDKAFWYDRFSIHSQLLDEYHVFPVNNYFINGLLRYSYDSRNPCYAYYFGIDENGIHNWKLYFPYADKSKGERKFIQNCSVIEGALHIRKADAGIIIKSYKDVIGLELIIRYLHLPLLALGASSESTILTPYQHTQIMEYVPILYTLSDYDRTGIRFAWKMRKAYNTIPLFFTNGRFGNPDFKAKDLTDNLELYGLDNMSNLVNNIYINGHKDFLKTLMT